MTESDGNLAASGFLDALLALGAESPDADGVSSLQVGDVTMHFAQPRSSTFHLVIRAEIGLVEDLAMPENYFEDLLSSAFLGRGLQFAVPSVVDGVAYLSAHCRMSRLASRDALSAFVSSFAALVREWRTRLGLCGKLGERGDGAASVAEIAVEPATYERMWV